MWFMRRNRERIRRGTNEGFLTLYEWCLSFLLGYWDREVFSDGYYGVK